jgi:hypothetical protein
MTNNRAEAKESRMLVSEWSADLIYTVSSIAVIIAGVIAYWASGVREKYGDQHLADTQAEVARAHESTEKIRQKNLQLALTLESEQSARLKTESILKSRTLSLHPSRAALGQFKGMRFVLESVRDDEARQFAAHLAFCLEYSGWKEVDWYNREDGEAVSGVGILANGVDNLDKADANDRTVMAARALVAWLETNDLKAFAFPRDFRHADPVDALSIVVGPSERLEELKSIKVKVAPEFTTLKMVPRDRQTSDNK